MLEEDSLELLRAALTRLDAGFTALPPLTAPALDLRAMAQFSVWPLFRDPALGRPGGAASSFETRTS